MTLNNKFWWFVLASIIVIFIVLSGLGLWLWQQRTIEERELLFRIIKEDMGYIFSASVLLLVVIGLALDGIFHNYIIPLSKITEDVQIINSVNPSHRVKLDGGKDIMQLAKNINEGAEQIEKIRKNVEEKIRIAKAQIEDERNILAAVMSELPEGVLICKLEGHILLFNKKAKLLLCDDEGSNLFDGHPSRFMGLGRSVFNLIDKNLIVHALDEVAEKIEKEKANTASYFVVTGRDNRFLRTELVPILNHRNILTGFVLIFYDITQKIETDSQISCLVQSLTTGFRSSLASIRSAVEAILEYPDMKSEQLDRFLTIIHKESVSLGDILSETASESVCRMISPWPLTPMLIGDLIRNIRKKADEKLDLRINIETNIGPERIKADSYSFALTILFLLDQLKDEIGISDINCVLKAKDKFVIIDWMWEGPPLPVEMLRQWDKQLVGVINENIPLTMREVFNHHDAEIWSYGLSDMSYLRLMIPSVEDPETETIHKLTILSESRPEFYDFDLFSQPGQTPELDNCRLTELSYTVFDTETTGLDPDGGDEIISIGAVRIVNGRLLRDDFFDQLVDPKRPLPLESIQIHGILPEMLEGQPTVDKVLPSFHQFAKDSVLVAHNAAFDMRMLEKKEEATGIKFINPVLDTLLLSAVVHPAQENHSLETIAERLGVNLIGRHTALGDAITTGELFLKLIPLLLKKGINTLKEARQASKNTYYSRIKY